MPIRVLDVNEVSTSKSTPLAAVLVLVALLGATDQALEFRNPTSHLLITFVLFVMVLGFAFSWLANDSENHQYRRSISLNMGIVVLPAVFIPVYLWKSRAPKQRLKALVSFLLFLLSLFAAYGFGVLTFAIATY